MKRIIFDIEANGFLEAVTKVWCLVLQDADTGDTLTFARHANEQESIPQGLHLLKNAETIIGHNVINYDIPVLEKLYPGFHVDHGKVCDTLTLSRLLHSDLSDADRGLEASLRPDRIGSHSLEAWGQRLGLEKITWEHGFDVYHPDMLEYCTRDVGVTARLYEYLQAGAAEVPRAVELEHRVAFICAAQERRGFPFDLAGAEALAAHLLQELHALELRLQDTFRPVWRELEVITPTKTINYKDKPGIWKDAPYTKIEWEVFNPLSRQQVADRLIKNYNWKPELFTPSGQAQVDEKILGKLEYPEAQMLARYFMLRKRYAYLVNADGERGLINNYVNGRVHGAVITNGAVTGRATHRIIANLPRVKTPYGPELRALFKPSPGKVQVGVDMSGIELRMLAHYMAYFDKGEYGKRVCEEEDIHVYHQNLVGLPTRDAAKTFIYALIYGSGDKKLGSMTNPKDGPRLQAAIGKELRARIFDKLPAFGVLTQRVKERVDNDGILTGLDGRKLRVRSSHAALNTLLQSAAAILSKQWMVNVDNLKYPSANQLIWYHDELQFEVDPDKAEDFGKLVVRCIEQAGEQFGIKVPLTGEYKIGNNWKECH